MFSWFSTVAHEHEFDEDLHEFDEDLHKPSLLQ